jgi:hypothetical protein
MPIIANSKSEDKKSGETAIIGHSIYQERGSFMAFLVSGLAFLFIALCMFILFALALFQHGPAEFKLSTGLGEAVVELGGVKNLSEAEIHNFYIKAIDFYLPPLLLLIAAIICSIVGIRLLRAIGAGQQVIPPQDYEVLAPAIRDGNEKAISEYIRLSSLLGLTGTATKVGLTGLPLATIILTILLAIMGLFNQKFFDLAQLTLGAFIGSFVQKKGENISSTETKQEQP